MAGISFITEERFIRSRVEGGWKSRNRVGYFFAELVTTVPRQSMGPWVI